MENMEHDKNCISNSMVCARPYTILLLNNGRIVNYALHTYIAIMGFSFSFFFIKFPSRNVSHIFIIRFDFFYLLDNTNEMLKMNFIQNFNENGFRELVNHISITYICSIISS